MTSKNDITGDELKTKQPTNAYREGWDRIFRKLPYEELKVDCCTPLSEKDAKILNGE